MNKNTDSINVLNQLLQGEYMAVDAFNTFISRVEDEEVKKGFQKVQENHRDNIQILADYIQNIGGKPEENLGLKGKMADFKINMNLGTNPHDSYIVDKAVEGETKGINMAEKVVRGNLDDKSRDIAGEVLHRDRRTLDELKDLKQE